VDNHNDNLKSKSGDLMAIGRTVMANERTLLSFLRTALGFFIGAIALIKYLKHPFVQALGWVFLFFAPVLLVWGIYRYRHVKKVLKAATPIDQVPLEKEIGL
jgi:inner membrane protein YidH